jgi:hypothetical protein
MTSRFRSIHSSLRFVDLEGKPRANAPAIVKVKAPVTGAASSRDEQELTTDGDGNLEVDVAADVTDGSVEIDGVLARSSSSIVGASRAMEASFVRRPCKVSGTSRSARRKTRRPLDPILAVSGHPKNSCGLRLASLLAQRHERRHFRRRLSATGAAMTSNATRPPAAAPRI